LHLAITPSFSIHALPIPAFPLAHRPSKPTASRTRVPKNPTAVLTFRSTGRYLFESVPPPQRAASVAPVNSTVRPAGNTRSVGIFVPFSLIHCFSAFKATEWRYGLHVQRFQSPASPMPVQRAPPLHLAITPSFSILAKPIPAFPLAHRHSKPIAPRTRVPKNPTAVLTFRSTGRYLCRSLSSPQRAASVAPVNSIVRRHIRHRVFQV